MYCIERAKDKIIIIIIFLTSCVFPNTSIELEIVNCLIKWDPLFHMCNIIFQKFAAQEAFLRFINVGNSCAVKYFLWQPLFFQIFFAK